MPHGNFTLQEFTVLFNEILISRLSRANHRNSKRPKAFDAARENAAVLAHKASPPAGYTADDFTGFDSTSSLLYDPTQGAGGLTNQDSAYVAGGPNEVVTDQTNHHVVTGPANVAPAGTTVLAYIKGGFFNSTRVYAAEYPSSANLDGKIGDGGTISGYEFYESFKDVPDRKLTGKYDKSYDNCLFTIQNNTVTVNLFIPSRNDSKQVCTSFGENYGTIFDTVGIAQHETKHQILRCFDARQSGNYDVHLSENISMAEGHAPPLTFYYSPTVEEPDMVPGFSRISNEIQNSYTVRNYDRSRNSKLDSTGEYELVPPSVLYGRPFCSHRLGTTDLSQRNVLRPFYISMRGPRLSEGGVYTNKLRGVNHTLFHDLDRNPIYISPVELRGNPKLDKLIVEIVDNKGRILTLNGEINIILQIERDEGPELGDREESMVRLLKKCGAL
jgi:hypothetical protein